MANASAYYEILSEEEKKKALALLNELNGLEVPRAMMILDFCKEAAKEKSIVKI